MDEGILLAVFIFAFVIMAIIMVYASRYKKVPPDKAMVVYGKRQAGKKGYRVISGGAKFIVPIVESYEFLPLDVRTLDVVVRDIVTDVVKSGAKVNPETLKAAGLTSGKHPVKILGTGELKKKLALSGCSYSAAAREKIIAAGGTAD